MTLTVRTVREEFTMTENRHDFNEGAPINEGGEETLKERWARQRLDAEQLLSKLEEERRKS